MYSYIIGKVEEIESNYITIDNNEIGYLIYTSNPYSFNLNQEYKIYLYENVREDELSLYGFKTKEEKDLFLKLISVKGIGCKTAIGILATGDVTSIISAIETGNVAYLKKIPGIGPKAAQQIILDLQGKFKNTTTTIINNNDLDEAAEVLVALGYKKAEVDKALAVLLNEKLDTNGYVKRALSLLVK